MGNGQGQPSGFQTGSFGGPSPAGYSLGGGTFGSPTTMGAYGNTFNFGQYPGIYGGGYGGGYFQPSFSVNSPSAPPPSGSDPNVSGTSPIPMSNTIPANKIPSGPPDTSGNYPWWNPMPGGIYSVPGALYPGPGATTTTPPTNPPTTPPVQPPPGNTITPPPVGSKPGFDGNQKIGQIVTDNFAPAGSSPSGIYGAIATGTNPGGLSNSLINSYSAQGGNNYNPALVTASQWSPQFAQNVQSQYANPQAYFQHRGYNPGAAAQLPTNWADFMRKASQ